MTICYGLPNIGAVDKLEQMLGSYGPAPNGEPHIKRFPSEESPSGMIARSGSYNVRSRIVDDDGNVYKGMHSIITMLFERYSRFTIDFEWSFKLAKEW